MFLRNHQCPWDRNECSLQNSTEICISDALVYFSKQLACSVLAGRFAFCNRALSRTSITKRHKKRCSMKGSMFVGVSRSQRSWNRNFSFPSKIHKQKRGDVDEKTEFPFCLEHVCFPCGGSLLNWQHKNLKPGETSIHASVLCPTKWRLVCVHHPSSKLRQMHPKGDGTFLLVRNRDSILSAWQHFHISL